MPKSSRTDADDVVKKWDFEAASDLSEWTLSGFVRANGNEHERIGRSGEYYLLNGISFWAQAGNMLNHCIALSPTHCAEGPFFTAGICLKLR